MREIARHIPESIPAYYSTGGCPAEIRDCCEKRSETWPDAVRNLYRHLMHPVRQDGTPAGELQFSYSHLTDTGDPDLNLTSFAFGDPDCRQSHDNGNAAVYYRLEENLPVDRMKPRLIVPVCGMGLEPLSVYRALPDVIREFPEGADGWWHIPPVYLPDMEKRIPGQTVTMRKEGVSVALASADIRAAGRHMITLLPVPDFRCLEEVYAIIKAEPDLSQAVVAPLYLISKIDIPRLLSYYATVRKYAPRQAAAALRDLLTDVIAAGTSTRPDGKSAITGLITYPYCTPHIDRTVAGAVTEYAKSLFIHHFVPR